MLSWFWRSIQSEGQILFSCSLRRQIISWAVVQFTLHGAGRYHQSRLALHGSAGPERMRVFVGELSEHELANQIVGPWLSAFPSAGHEIEFGLATHVPHP